MHLCRRNAVLPLLNKPKDKDMYFNSETVHLNYKETVTRFPDKSLRRHALTFPLSVRSRPRLSLPSPKIHLYKQLASSENAASPRGRS